MYREQSSLKADCTCCTCESREPTGKRWNVTFRGIRPRFRERVILHDHFELAEEYGLRGIHLKYNEARTFTGRNRFAHVSVSCHSFEEIDALPFEPNYVFLSPVFDSISKPGYPSAFTPEYLKENLQKRRVPVIALGESPRKKSQNVGKWDSAGSPCWDTCGNSRRRPSTVSPISCPTRC